MRKFWLYIWRWFLEWEIEAYLYGNLTAYIWKATSLMQKGEFDMDVFKKELFSRQDEMVSRLTEIVLELEETENELTELKEKKWN